MKTAETGRRAVAEVGWAGEPARIVWVAGRGLHHYWPLLSAYFREALLPPHRRADGDSVIWTWDEPDGAKPGTASELAALRRRLAEEQRWFAENLVRGLAGAGGGAGPGQAGVDQLGGAMAETTARLAALPDDALAGFVCRTEHGLRLHSWSALTPACPTYPDTVAAETSAPASGPIAPSPRRRAGRRKAWFVLGGILVGIHVVWAIQHFRTRRPPVPGQGNEPASPAKSGTETEPASKRDVAGPTVPPAIPAPPVAAQVPEKNKPGSAEPDLPAGPPVEELARTAVMPGIAPRARGMPNAPAPIAVPDGPAARPRTDAVVAGGVAARTETAGGLPRRGPGAEREKTAATTGRPAAPVPEQEIAVRGADLAPSSIKDVALIVRDSEPAAPRTLPSTPADEEPGALPAAPRAPARADSETETASAVPGAAGPPPAVLAQRRQIRWRPGSAVWLGDRVLPTLPRRVDRAPDLRAVATEARRLIEATRPATLAGLEFRVQIRLRPRGPAAGDDAPVWRWAATPAPATLRDGDGRPWAEVTTEAPDEITLAWADAYLAELEIETPDLAGWTWTAATGGTLPAEWSSERTADGFARLRIPLGPPGGAAVRADAAWTETATGWARLAELRIAAADDVVK